DSNNYALNKAHTPRGTFLVMGLSTFTAGAPTDPVAATLTINGGSSLPGGRYTLLITGASPSGVADVAGNFLRGGVYGSFPSGNAKPGSDFIARLIAIHHRVLPPIPVRGTVPPSGTSGGGGEGAPALRVKLHSTKVSQQSRVHSAHVPAGPKAATPRV